MSETTLSNNKGIKDNIFGWAEKNLHVVLPLGLLLILVVFMGIIAPRFLSPINLIRVARAASVYIILSVGMTFVITSGGIDLSIGSTLGLTSVVMGAFVMDQMLNPYMGMLFSVVFGMVLGLFIGILIAYVKVPPFIATIAMMASYRGLALVHSAGEVRYGFPEPIIWLGQGSLFGIPAPIIVAILIAVFGHILFVHTRFGRYCTAIGGNEEAARRAGIPVARYKMLVYVFMAALAGFGGVVLTGRLDGTQAVLGDAMELHVIASVIIGGTSLFGGRGSIVGSVIGALILGLVANALVLLRVEWFWQRVAEGVIVILAVMFNMWREKKLKEMMSN